MQVQKLLANPFVIFATLILVAALAIWFEVYVQEARPYYTTEEELESSIEQFGIFAPYLL